MHKMRSKISLKVIEKSTNEKFFNLIRKSQSFGCIKINDEYFCITNEKDLIQDVDILGSFVFYDRNIAIGILYPHIILEYPILKDRFPNITMDSNPILVYTKLK